MAKQLHKRFSTEEVKMLLQKYLNEKVELTYILEILKIKRRRFFELLEEYRKDPDRFSIGYQRRRPTRKIPDKVEKDIIKELEIAKSIIEDKDLPITHYNYSYIQDQLEKKVSLPTIIRRAKDKGFYKPNWTAYPA